MCQHFPKGTQQHKRSAPRYPVYNYRGTTSYLQINISASILHYKNPRMFVRSFFHLVETKLKYTKPAKMIPSDGAENT